MYICIHKNIYNDKVNIRIYTHTHIRRYLYILHIGLTNDITCIIICDRPRENRPSSHLGMIVEIPVLKVVNSITSFCSS